MRVLITPEWYPDASRPVFRRLLPGTGSRDGALARRRWCSTWTYDSASTRAVPHRAGAPRTASGRSASASAARASRSRRARSSSPGSRRSSSGCAARVWRPDVIHAHEYLAGRVALQLGRVLRCPVVVSEHYGGFARGVVPPDDRAAARDVFERAAVVCPVSGDLEGHLRAIAPDRAVRDRPRTSSTTRSSIRR